MGLWKNQRDFTTAVLDIVLYTFGPLKSWNVEPDFRQSACSELVDLLDGIVLYQVCQFFSKKGIAERYIEGIVVVKRIMLWRLFGVPVFVNIFGFELVWRGWVQSIHRSFVGWTGGAQLPTTIVVLPPEAKRRCAWRQATATWRLRSSFCPKRPKWTPRPTMARGLKASQAGGPYGGSLTRCLWRKWNFGKNVAFSANVWQSRGFPPLNIRPMTNANVGINDLNGSQCNMPVCPKCIKV